MVFRILPFDFFRDWYGEIFEVRDGQNRLLAMIQLLDVEKDLYFHMWALRKTMMRIDKLPASII